MADDAHRIHGVRAAVPALVAAVAFGLTFPAVKALLGDLPALWGAGWLYLASGIGLSLLRLTRWVPRGLPLAKGDVVWLAGAIAWGGILAPFAQVAGISLVAASAAALLANLEVVFSALLAIVLFRERLSRRRVGGIAVLLLGGVVAAGVFERGLGGAAAAGVVLLALAGFGWGLDNNLTRRIAEKDAVEIARWKGLVGGAAALALAATLGAFPAAAPGVWLGGGLVGFVGYGLSLVLFVRSLRTLGAAVTTAVFGVTATVVGCLASAVFLGESLSASTGIAAVLVLVGVALATWGGGGTRPDLGSRDPRVGSKSPRRSAP